MCGIAGIFYWSGASSLERSVVAMTERLARRGPDGSGVHAEPGVSLGHRRLSIIDLSERAAQPIANEDGTVWLTFNGEVYNYRELRRRLEARGHRFRSDSDSEVLVHLYEDSADELSHFLQDVRGMFAFAVWDGPRRRLLLARDRLGIKPLYYYLGDEFIAFASDLDALTACEAVPRRVDWTSVYEYLVLLTVPGPNTIFRDIHALTPATMVVLDDRGRTSEHTYWSLDGAIHDSIDGESDEALEAELADSIRLHMVADVEVGAFLSGGIDSGLVTALAAATTDRPLHTFSATFPGEGVDEGPAARDAAAKLGTEHDEFAIEGSFLDGVERVVEAMDQPLALTSAVSLFHLSRRARERIKVVLTGDGGDELFGGYSRHGAYPVPRRLAWIPEEARPRVGRLGKTALEGLAGRAAPFARLHAATAALARTDTELYTPRLYTMAPETALSLLPDGVSAEVDPRRYLDRVERLFERCREADRLTRMLYVDIQSSLVDEMLTKVDRMTMASGLEARVPLLDHKAVELAMRIRGGTKRDAKVGKLPLRRLVSRLLGREAAERPKSGFNSPLETWLRSDLSTQSTFDELWEAAEGCGAFDCRALQALRADFDSGIATANNLFAVLVYGVWARQRGVQAT